MTSCQCAARACEMDVPDGKAGLPVGWFKRCIDESDYILCDVSAEISARRADRRRARRKD